MDSESYEFDFEAFEVLEGCGEDGRGEDEEDEGEPTGGVRQPANNPDDPRPGGTAKKPPKEEKELELVS